MENGIVQNCETFNRKKAIKWLVENNNNNKSFSINIVAIIRISDELWRSVIPQTILNGSRFLKY